MKRHYTRSFLKWAGGKSKSLDIILPQLTKSKTLVEPFVGAGNVFINAEFEHYILADKNPDLINVYTHLKEKGDPFIEQVRLEFIPENNARDIFLSKRAEFNAAEINSEKRAVLFIYLNRHCFNGLCRYNRKEGAFNVNFGDNKKPYFPEEELRIFHRKLQRAELYCQTFQESFAMADKDCVIYSDPPFIPLSDTSNFVNYMATGFSLKDHLELDELSKSSEATAFISNHGTEFTYDLYGKNVISKIPVLRSINCKGDKRGAVYEILVKYKPVLADSK